MTPGPDARGEVNKVDELFVKMPHWVIRETDLTPNEMSLYMALRSRADKYGRCFPSTALLSRDTRMSESTVKRTRKILVAKGILQIEHRRGDGPRNASNLYRVALPKRLKKGGHFEPTEDVEPVDEHDDDDSLRFNLTPSTGQSDPQGGVRLTQEEEPLEEDPLKKILSLVQEHEAEIGDSSDGDDDGQEDDVQPFEFVDDSLTDKQYWLLWDLYILINNRIPEITRQERWHEMTVKRASEWIGHYYRELGRGGMYEGPERGSVEYNALTKVGKQWADDGCIPDEWLKGAA